MTSAMPRRVRPSAAVLPTDGRRQNLSLVLQTLRRLGPTSRAQLAREVGVTKVTMSHLVSELIDEGRVLDVGTAEQDGPGKRATLVDLDRARLLTLAVDLSVPARLRAAVLDITGEVVVREERAAAVDAAQGRGVDPAVVVELVLATIARSPYPVLGIGIGTPGLVDRNGTVRTAPNLGWTDVPLQALVAEATGLPVLVSNDSDAATQAELSASPGSEDMVLVHVGRGVGCGIVTGGRRVSGAHHAAGEIGHVTVGTDGGEDCPCGKRGLPRDLAVDPPAARRARLPRRPRGRRGRRRAPRRGPRPDRRRPRPVRGRPRRAGGAARPGRCPSSSAPSRSACSPTPTPPCPSGSPRRREDIVLRGAAAVVLWDRLGVV